MAEQTNIQWADMTWNPVIGCSRVHAGCQNCYAQAYGKRFGVLWGPNGTRRKTSDANWRKPLAWNTNATVMATVVTANGYTPPHRPRVFPSLCDPFEDWQGPIVNHHNEPLILCPNCGIEVNYNTEGEKGCKNDPLTMDDLRRDFFALIDATPNLDWLLLTKRPENIRRMMLPWLRDRMGAGLESPDDAWRQGLPIPNTWLIYSASDQETLEAGLPHLLKCRDLVPVLGLSLEPLVGPVTIPAELLKQLDWVIVGGESGPNARPMHPDWVRSIRDQCKALGVAFFFKQWGEHRLYECGDGDDEGGFYTEFRRVGKKAAGHLLDGQEHHEWPEVKP